MEIKEDMKNNIIYKNIPTLDLTKEQLEQCSKLFSENYGNYSEKSVIRPGERVKMGVSYYQKNYVKDDFSVALAIDKEEIIGQAFYIRKNYEKVGTMTWIVQLVVNKTYRKMGIASKLLRSIWGFSDDFAWGLATANPCTVKTLESATMRKCKPAIIEKHLKDISLIGKDIGFVEDGALEVDKHSSQVNSHFDVDNSSFEGKEEYENRLGKLRPGREWLAFTFREQGIYKSIYKSKFNRIIKFSEEQLRDAYSRMSMKNQKWASGQKNEIDYILSKINNSSKNLKIIDFGCGVGRHSLELAQKGFNVYGIDYSEDHIASAEKNASDKKITNTKFVCGDIRKFKGKSKYDLALCLYDVIGSYPDKRNNERILQIIYNSLEIGGFLALSVMNYELTDKIVPNKQKGKVKENPDLLLKLKPATIMQTTGDIFDPKYIVIDKDEHLIYRKEQFSNDGKLSAEYVIRDKRYTMKEIVEMLQKKGFKIVDKRYVRAGHFDEALKSSDAHAKEILIIAKK